MEKLKSQDEKFFKSDFHFVIFRFIFVGFCLFKIKRKYFEVFSLLNINTYIF